MLQDNAVRIAKARSIIYLQRGGRGHSSHGDGDGDSFSGGCADGDGGATRGFGMIENTLESQTSEVGIKKAVSQGHIALQPCQLHSAIAMSYTQARSASDNSVNNAVCWGAVVFAAGGASHGPTSVTRLHSPRFCSAGPTCLL